MWKFKASQLFAVIVLMSAVHGILVVGPKFIRPHQNYMLVVSNFNSQLNKVDLKVRMEGQSEAGETVLHESKMVEVRRNMNRKIEFNLPGNLSPGNYRITIEGQQGFSFHKTVELVLHSKSISGVIQMDKPVFKPGDMVKFRVIVLDTELRPPVGVKSISVTIRDSQTNEIRRWASAKLEFGVFDSNLQLATAPNLGVWEILVELNGEELVSKTFEVKEYVLPSFDLQVSPTRIPVVSHGTLNLMIAANYHFGKPVQGLAKIELYLEDGQLDQKKDLEIYGTGQVELRFANVLIGEENVQVKVSFIEKITNRTVVRREEITVHEHPFRVELITGSAKFRPNFPFKCTLQLRYHDGKPAVGITGNVEVYEIGYEETFTSDSKGLIKFELPPQERTNVMTIIFTNDMLATPFEQTVFKAETNHYLKLELTSPIKLNHQLRLLVKCSNQMTNVVYYVVSKGNIIDSGMMSTNRQVKYVLKLKVAETMTPKAKIIVATVTNRAVLIDSIDIDFERFRHNFRMSIDEQELRPGKQIELSMSGRPRAYVGLAAYDKGLLAYGGHHDLFWEDILKVYDDFHRISDNEYDLFHSMGLFARTLNDIVFDGADDKSLRNGQQSNEMRKLVAYRTKFLESWLWKNVSIGISGNLKLIEEVPDTITSWYLTGFSIDPVYGLGIIKKPIEFTTVQPFYIVDNLPYSIKRGEAAVLQFTLFNNLGDEYAADVTLYNVAEQIEIIGLPLETPRYTKSLSVPTNVGVPVSFLVKARKLGELVVRVKASIMDGKETDALEKVIQVIPESVVQSYMESRFFSTDTYQNKTYTFNLNLNKKADENSREIKFIAEPNLLTSVITNLEQLIEMPSGCGEQNMIEMVPRIVVLEYLSAIRSKDTVLIEKTKTLLRQGYQSQMRYRQTNGAFGVWQNDSSVFLTAFVAKSMKRASKHISDVDGTMVDKAFEWLVSKQHSSGRFDEVGATFYKEVQGASRNGVALTSYVLAALLENENTKVKYAAAIQKGMNYLSEQWKNIQSIYDLSIATYALMLYEHRLKDDALKKLLSVSTVSEDRNERYWYATHSVEATAYALLSFIKAEKYVDGLQVMRWLVNQRSVSGAFQGTQDTFVGMEAITKFANHISPSRNDYTITLKFNNTLKYFAIQPDDITKAYYNDIPEHTKLITVDVAGRGFGLLQVAYQYSLDLRNFENRFKLTLEKHNTGSDYELRMRVCANFIPSLTDELSNMALIEVNFPSGYVVDRNPISEQSWLNPIKKIEIRYGSTSVVVYYDNMGIERNCFTVTAYRRFKVALIRPAYVIVYDYYKKELNAIQVYQVEKQSVCDICERNDCSVLCNN